MVRRLLEAKRAVLQARAHSSCDRNERAALMGLVARIDAVLCREAPLTKELMSELSRHS